MGKKPQATLELEMDMVEYYIPARGIMGLIGSEGCGVIITLLHVLLLHKSIKEVLYLVVTWGIMTLHYDMG